LTDLTIRLQDGAAVEPGARVRVAVAWTADDEPERLELCLLWRTLGKGTQDVELVRTLALERPGRAGEHVFELDLPDYPWSFSGKLVTLEWTLEALLEPGDAVARETLVLAPGAAEIRLG
jgi:hypothetical protein